jgi:hypothetical protein
MEEETYGFTDSRGSTWISKKEGNGEKEETGNTNYTNSDFAGSV